MDMTEYNKVSDMTYLEYCDYLQGKYGIGLCDYMTKSYNKNKKVTRTKEGLFVHHKMEDHMIMLAQPEIAQMCPIEWQKKENLVYCDYLEHLFLHILICKYPAADKVPIAKVGIGGVVNFLVPELNDIFSGWEPKLAWKKNCVDRIKDNKDVYLVLLERFIRENKDDSYFEIEKLLRSYNEEYGGWSQKNNSELNNKIKDIYKNCNVGD